MADFPQDQVTPLYLPIFSTYGGGVVLGGMLNFWNTFASAAWPAANVAIYQPFSIPWPYYVARAFWANGSAAGGNWDIGIYTIGGARLWSAGSTAGTGNSVLQYVNAGILLQPGMYFIGVNHDVTTANHASGSTVFTAAGGRLVGCYEQSVGATALPSPATFASWTRTFAPLCGITRV